MNKHYKRPGQAKPPKVNSDIPLKNFYKQITFDPIMDNMVRAEQLRGKKYTPNQRTKNLDNRFVALSCGHELYINHHDVKSTICYQCALDYQREIEM
jgi:hypothetical protein